MFELFSGFDALGLGALVGSLLFLGALVWVLVDNRSFDVLNQKTLSDDREAEEGHASRPLPGRPAPAGQSTRDPEPTRPTSGRRAA